MKNLLLTLALITHHSSLITSISAQPAIEWQKCLGGSASEQAKSIQQTSDGGYVVTGSTLSNNGDVTGNYGGYDFWVVKLSSIGAIQWQKTLGGSNNDWAFCIQQTNDGGYIVAGNTRSTDGDVAGHHGEQDAWVVKLNSIGVIQWQKALGGSFWDEAWSVRQTTDGGYIMAGRTASQDGDVTGWHGALDFWVVKLDGTGAIEWQKSLGGTGDDIAYSIRQTNDGGYIVTGESGSSDGDATGLHGGSDYWVLKLSHAGELEWQKMLGSTSVDRPNEVFPTNDGGYVVVGIATWNDGDVTGNHGGADYWVVKLNGLGEIQWQKSFGGSDQDFAQSIKQTNDGGYIIAGNTSSEDGDVLDNDGGQDIWIVKLTPEGEIQWQKTLGGTQGEAAYSIQQTSDEGYIVCGLAWSNNGDVSGIHGVNDFWVVKLSPESVGTEDIAARAGSLGIYPNPASSTVTFRSDTFSKSVTSNTSLIVCITDLLGREMLRQEVADNGSLSIAHLPNGVYFAKATAPSGRAYVGKLIKGE